MCFEGALENIVQCINTDVERAVTSLDPTVNPTQLLSCLTVCSCVRLPVPAPVLGSSLFVMLMGGPTCESTFRVERAEGAAGTMTSVSSLVSHLQARGHFSQ